MAPPPDFLCRHENRVAIHKLRTIRQLTPTDLEEPERILRDGDVESDADFARAKEAGNGLRLFVRSPVGLDRASAKEAFGVLLTGKPMSANQQQFVDMIINELTVNGVMGPGRL